MAVLSYHLLYSHEHFAILQPDLVIYGIEIRVTIGVSHQPFYIAIIGEIIILEEPRVCCLVNEVGALATNLAVIRLNLLRETRLEPSPSSIGVVIP